MYQAGQLFLPDLTCLHNIVLHLAEPNSLNVTTTCTCLQGQLHLAGFLLRALRLPSSRRAMRVGQLQVCRFKCLRALGSAHESQHPVRTTSFIALRYRSRTIIDWLKKPLD